MNDLQTFDILLCAGDGRFSKVIQKWNRINGYEGVEAEISHVAGVIKIPWLDLVLKLRNIEEADPNDLYVFESTTLNWNGKKGVQINPLDQWIDNYDGKAWVRHVTTSAFNAEPAINWMAKQIGRPYENGLGGLLELITCYMPWVPLRRTIEPHCSELIAELFQRFGLMLPVNPSKLPPAMWWEDIDDRMPVHVSPPEILKG